VRALVTGAAGFVGSNLAWELAQAGEKVVGLDDFSVGHFENLRGFPGDVIAADLAQPQQWAGRIGKVDVIFHEAAITDTTVMDQMKMMRVNVEAFRDLLAFAAETGVKKVVYASSAGVYGDLKPPQRETAQRAPLNIYAFSKMVMENAASEFQAAHPRMELVGLRYFNVFGPREKFKNKASSMIWQLSQQMLAGRRPRIFEDGEQYRDHIYVKDVVQANLLAAGRKVKGVFNVCTGKGTTFNKIIEHLNAALRTSLEPDYFKNPYSFYQNETLGDPAAAAKAFGFRARYSVAEGIKDYFSGLKVPAGV